MAWSHAGRQVALISLHHDLRLVCVSYRTDMADVPLLAAITETFGPSMWFNTIVALTHAAAAPPDGNNGPLTYDTYTRGRTQLLQQNIR